MKSTMVCHRNDIHFLFKNLLLALFNQNFLVKPEEHSIESLDQMLQLFPDCMQNHELPIEHMLTTCVPSNIIIVELVPNQSLRYDIALRAGDEPQYPGRADFLTESILNSTTVYEALKEGRFAPTRVKVPWHRSIASTLGRLDEDFRSDPQEMMEYLQEFNLSGDNVSEFARDLERAACQQLVTDLALSSEIFSETKFPKVRAVGHSLETMTAALSLGGEPPPIEFGYLQPLAPRPMSHGIDNTPLQHPEIPLGVRLLLKDWDIGNLDGLDRDPSRGLGSITPEVAAVHKLQNTVAQRPPPILPSTSLKGQSQELMPSARSESEPESPIASSQNFAISTQVLPASFGGRPMVKKKPTKKRLGGF
jgi:hypothetical protein